jgi:hypothetical protein
MKTHRDLIVYQKSISFVTEIYALTADFPNLNNLELYLKCVDVQFLSHPILPKVPRGIMLKNSFNFFMCHLDLLQNWKHKFLFQKI